MADSRLSRDWLRMHLPPGPCRHCVNRLRRMTTDRRLAEAMSGHCCATCLILWPTDLLARPLRPYQEDPGRWPTEITSNG